MITPANQGLLAVRDVCEPIPSEGEYFGVDNGGPLPLHYSEGVEVPQTNTTLTDVQVEDLRRITSLADDVGIDAYLRGREFTASVIS